MYVGKRTRLANLTILGDVELVDRLADALVEKLRGLEFDYLVGPQIKIVPLIHGVAKRLGHKKFVVCRKTVKPYMVSPIIIKPMRNTPKHIKQMVINGSDAQILKNKKVVLLDDVVSTGVTLLMLKKLMEKIGTAVVANVAVIKQGKQFEPIENLIYLGELPIFKDEK